MAWRDELPLRSRPQADYGWTVLARVLSWVEDRGARRGESVRPRRSAVSRITGRQSVDRRRRDELFGQGTISSASATPARHLDRAAPGRFIAACMVCL